MMTQAEYARHRRVSRQAISKLVKAGRIPVDGNGKIDPAAADFALGEDRSRIDEPRAAAPGESSGLTKARTATEVYKAKLAQLQYEKALGNVVSTEGVTQAAIACVEVVQRVVRRVSGLAEELAAVALKDGVPGTRVRLKQAEREILEQLSQAFDNLARDAVNNQLPQETDREPENVAG